MGQHLTDGRADDALAALTLAETDPSAALAAADEVRAHSEGVPAAIADWCRGVALRNLGRGGEAAEALQSAHDALSRSGEVELAARVAVPLAGTHLAAGRADLALDLLSAAAPSLSGPEAVAASGQRALVMQRCGRTVEALEAWNDTVELADRHGLGLELGKALHNRALAHGYAGRLDAAAADLGRAKACFEQLGDTVRIAGLTHNEGFLAHASGDLPSALRLFDEAQQLLRGAGVLRPQMLVDRVETLLEAGLRREARRIAMATVDLLLAGSLETDAAEACLLVARASQDEGAVEAAIDWAERATRMFVEQERDNFVPLARLASVRARSAEASSGEAAELAAELDGIGAQLRKAGWAHASTEADVLCAGLFIDSGDLARAEVVLQSLWRRDVLSARDRVSVAVLRARRHLAASDELSTRQALEEALRAVQDHQRTLGAVELQSAASVQAEELVTIGVDLEQSAARPGAALWWAEHVRDRVRLRQPIDDPESASARLALREVSARLDHEPLDAREAAAVRNRQAALEEILRRRSHHASPAPDREPADAVTPDALVEELGGGALVHYVRSRGVLAAFLFRDGEYREAELADAYEIRRSLASLRLALHRVIREPEDAADIGAVRRAASALDAQLVAPLWRGNPPPAAVVVPGPLGAVPWALLPNMEDVAVAVSTSGGEWSRGRSRLRSTLRGASAFAVAGPGPAYAASEVAEVCRARPRSVVLEGEEALVGATMNGLALHDIAHIAAHGSFRSDNPLLSSIRLTDGPLTGYDLATIMKPPALLVLSCCEMGMQSEEPGALGLVSLLLSIGVASVIASPNAVEDACSPAFMQRVHAALSRGEMPAFALVEARRAATGDRDSLVAGSFVSYGS